MAEFITVGSSGAFQLESAANYSLRTTHEGGQTVYYSTSPRVSSTINDGSLTTGLSFTFTGRRFFITQSGTGTQGSSASLRLDNVPVLGESVPVTISFSVTTYGGADPTGVVDATSAIQSTINACAGAGGGIVFLPAGTYKCLGGLTLPKDAAVNLIGAGMRSTTLSFPNDLGANVYGLGTTGTSTRLRNRLEDFTVVGPTTGTLGVIPANMKGIFAADNFRFTRVRSYGTLAGVDNQGDHITYRDCDFGGYYSILFGSPVSGGAVNRGNSLVEGCDLSGALRASLAITTGNAIEGGTFLQTHFGFAPYGIELVDDASNRIYATQIGTCTFTDCAFEQIGNCGIFDSGTGGGFGGLNALRFTNCGGPIQSDTYRIGAAAKDYAIDVKTIADLVIEGGGSSVGGFAGSPFAVGFIRASGELDNVVWFNAQSVLDVANSSGKPIFETTVANGVMYAGRMVCGLIRNEVGSIAAGELMEWADYSGTARGQKYVGGGGGVPAGVAVNARGAGKIVPVAMAGQLLSNVDVGTAARTYLVPSATSGKMQAGIATAQPRVGISETAESGGQLRAHLNLPGAWPT